jgi:capsular polysaccharide biosynthesis protein
MGRRTGMTCVSVERPSGARRVLWCLRQYAWVVVVCVLALAAAPLVLAPVAPTYQADALVVARQLTVERQVLPEMAETLFGSGNVAARVAAEAGVGDPGALIPDRLSVVAAQDSIALVVQARDPDPATAARMADLATDAFLEELNKPGAGVGEFVVQAPAIVPTEPLTELPAKVRGAVGGLAGLVLGLGLVGLVAAIRRPVVTYEDVESAAGVPLLGTVQLPKAVSGTYSGPLGVPGIPGVVRWLSAVPAGRLLLISAPDRSSASSAAWVRNRLFVMLGVALCAARGSMRFDGPPALVETIEQLSNRHEPHSSARPQGEGAQAKELTLVDDGSPLELVDPAATNVSVAVIAPLGVSRRRLRAVAAEFVGGGLVGVVLVDARPGAQRAATRKVRAATAKRPLEGIQRDTAEVPEPEPA